MKWIKVDDRLPPQDVEVLVVVYDGREKVKMNFTRIAYRLGTDWIHGDNGERMNPKYGRVTHWIPLPDFN